MSRLLHVAADLTMPDDAVTQTFCLFGKRGSGKSNTAVVLAEEMHKAGAPFVVLDPISAWWGLKSSFDGKGPGLPVYVFGGPHGDLPLQPGAGELMAQVFVRHRQPMVLDMKGWTGAERAKFVTAFAEWLLGHNDRVPVHVFLEEADAFIPQRPYKGEERMLGAMDRLVRWGRQEGVGSTTVTQRSAKINKDVTTQTEVLIAHRTTGPQDRDVIRDWIRYHAGDEEQAQILSTLPTLADGTAWVWSPEWLGLLRQVAFRRRETFDSASTPKLGEKRIAPKALAPVDLDTLRDQLAETIEKARADDPRELRRRIAVLERLVEEQRAIANLKPIVAEPEVRIERIEVPVITAEQMDALHAVRRALEETLEVVGSQLQAFGRELAIIQSIAQDEPTNGHAPKAPATTKVGATVGRFAAVAVSRSLTKVRPVVTREPVGAFESDVKLGSAERTFLSALATHRAGLSKAQLSLITGYSAKSGHFANILGRLRTAGLINRGWPAQITDDGIVAAGDVERLPGPGPELVEYWYGRVGKAERAMLEVFVGDYPRDVDRADLGARTGYSPASGHFANVLGRLRSLGLINGWRASEDLMG